MDVVFVKAADSFSDLVGDIVVETVDPVILTKRALPPEPTNPIARAIRQIAASSHDNAINAFVKDSRPSTLMDGDYGTEGNAAYDAFKQRVTGRLSQDIGFKQHIMTARLAAVSDANDLRYSKQKGAAQEALNNEKERQYTIQTDFIKKDYDKIVDSLGANKPAIKAALDEAIIDALTGKELPCRDIFKCPVVPTPQVTSAKPVAAR